MTDQDIFQVEAAQPNVHRDTRVTQGDPVSARERPAELVTETQRFANRVATAWITARTGLDRINETLRRELQELTRSVDLRYGFDDLAPIGSIASLADHIVCQIIDDAIERYSAPGTRLCVDMSALAKDLGVKCAYIDMDPRGRGNKGGGPGYRLTSRRYDEYTYDKGWADGFDPSSMVMWLERRYGHGAGNEESLRQVVARFSREFHLTSDRQPQFNSKGELQLTCCARTRRGVENIEYEFESPDCIKEAAHRLIEVVTALEVEQTAQALMSVFKDGGWRDRLLPKNTYVFGGVKVVCRMTEVIFDIDKVLTTQLLILLSKYAPNDS